MERMKAWAPSRLRRRLRRGPEGKSTGSATTPRDRVGLPRVGSASRLRGSELLAGLRPSVRTSAVPRLLAGLGAPHPSGQRCNSLRREGMPAIRNVLAGQP